jgi:hypothetical protein
MFRSVIEMYLTGKNVSVSDRDVSNGKKCFGQ